jgi:hypothetical protein
MRRRYATQVILLSTGSIMKYNIVMKFPDSSVSWHRRRLRSVMIWDGLSVCGTRLFNRAGAVIMIRAAETPCPETSAMTALKAFPVSSFE